MRVACSAAKFSGAARMRFERRRAGGAGGAIGAAAGTGAFGMIVEMVNESSVVVSLLGGAGWLGEVGVGANGKNVSSNCTSREKMMRWDSRWSSL